AISPNGLLGDRVIQDTHHPTLIGYVALAGAVLRELQLRKTFGQSQPIPLPLDPATCAQHFGMDATKWATMCDRTSVHYQRVAGEGMSRQGGDQGGGSPHDGGVLILNKSRGMTSRAVVDRVVSLVPRAKAGHAGTLDPLASGVLIICLGPATRLVEMIQRLPK